MSAPKFRKDILRAVRAAFDNHPTHKYLRIEAYQDGMQTYYDQETGEQSILIQFRIKKLGIRARLSRKRKEKNNL